jgi:hypothetical protein
VLTSSAQAADDVVIKRVIGQRYMGNQKFLLRSLLGLGFEYNQDSIVKLVLRGAAYSPEAAAVSMEIDGVSSNQVTIDNNQSEYTIYPSQAQITKMGDIYSLHLIINGALELDELEIHLSPDSSIP